jgi:putative SOS response-associated peptidase YedK
MCGRFTLTVTPEALAQAFDLDSIPADFPPRYNIAPSQPIAAILKTPEHPERHLQLLRWGLIPSWAKDPAIGNRLINARAESLAEKPSFRAAFKRRRCLIPSTGFYEWQKRSSGKQPYFIGLRDSQPFAFAGLWETWEDISTATIITTDANPLLQPIHERMPVILRPQDYDLWLDPHNQNPAELQTLLKPFPAADMAAYPIGNQVNNPAHDGPDCIAPKATA